MQQVTVGRLAIILGMLVALGPLAIDTYLPALPIIAEHLKESVGQVEGSVPLYLIGAALGQLVGGPLSDKFGRHRTAYVGLGIFAITSVAIAFINTLPQLMVLRFIQALGGGATVVVAGASVRDFYSGTAAARVFNTIGLVMLLAPLLAPAIGSVILHLVNWQAIFIMLALYAVWLVFVVRFSLPRTEIKGSATNDSPIAAYIRVIKKPRAVGYIFTNAMAFATMFVFITDSAFLYMEHFGASSKQFPLLFGANVVLMLIFNRLNVVLLRRYEPTSVLWMGLIIQVGAAATFFILTVFNLLTLPITVPLIMLITGAVALIVPNCLASFLSLFEHDAGAAAGLNGAMQFMLAGIVGATVSALHTGSLLPMAVLMMLASITAVSSYAFVARKVHQH